MSRALSLDLRLRAVAAVEAGMTHRAAAERFGVSAASISRWRAIARAEGEPRPRPLGGDRRSARVEMAAPTILATLEATPDLTINELRARLAKIGLSFGFGTIQRFFRRHAITRKKRLRTRSSRAVRTS